MYIKDITKVHKSKVTSLDFDNIPFGKVFTDHMFTAEYYDGAWQDFKIRPLENLSIHPGNLAWHYGQAIFEGMKATITHDGTPLLFRPQEHVTRINASAHRMCMPEFPGDVFLEAIEKLVFLEKDWIPPKEGSALYLRPLMIATDEAIGVRPSENYKFIIMALPVGPYYDHPVKLKAETKYIRAAKGGVGEAKTAGNYAASLYPAKLAKEEGFDQIMWLDANEFKYVQEVGTMNIFFVIDGEVLTPSTDGTILKGITRKSVIELFRSKGYKVTERPITIDEVCEAYDKGILEEVFGTGTAAVISEVALIQYKDKTMKFDPSKFKASKLAKSTINGMRSGKIEDEFGWIIRLEQVTV